MNAIEENTDWERGAATIIEMTLIFPLVLFTVVALFVVGMYIIHSITAYSAAQSIAVAAAREVQMPGYTKLYDEGGVTNQTDFDWEDGYMPDSSVVNSIMKTHTPYRYWNLFGNLVPSDSKATLEKGFRELWASAAFLNGGPVSCDITTENVVLAQYVNVHVKQTVDFPSFLKIIGIEDQWDIDIFARAVVSDSSEFIRNTDMVFDLGSYLWNDLKFGDNNQSMSERVAIFGQKLKDAKAKLGWT